MKTCAFAGHSFHGMGYLPGHGRFLLIQEMLELLIERLIQQKGVTHFISGMAQGVDMEAARIVLQLKEQYPQITLECVLPYPGHASLWQADLADQHFAIVRDCDKKTVIRQARSAECWKPWNRYIVDHADILLAVWDGKPKEEQRLTYIAGFRNDDPNGTADRVQYAREAGKPVWIMRPHRAEVQMEPAE